MPQGTQGKVLAVINSLESILASWFILRRGCEVTFIIIKNSNKKILEKFVSDWYLKSKIINLENKSVLSKILNEKSHYDNFDAIVVGNVIGENISKSIYEIYELKKNVNNLVLHPLISLERDEIIKRCKKIGI